MVRFADAHRPIGRGCGRVCFVRSRASIIGAGSLFGPPVEVDAGAAPANLVVLSSSSSGNCSAILHGSGRLRRVTLIDAGLSPLRTRLLLSRFGVGLEHVDDVLVTHLDGDHFHRGWIKALGPRTRLHLHESHAPRARRDGWPVERLHLFDDAVRLRSGDTAQPIMLSHDEWGVAAFRVEFAGSGRSLGYATDVGSVTASLTRAMAGVDVLAIESNYCPRMQQESDRPVFLKSRITGGSGHLSNQECAVAVQAIRPRRHVVLLHLSRQCNTPEKASEPHAGAPYGLTIARPDEPTAEVPLTHAQAGGVRAAVEG